MPDTQVQERRQFNRENLSLMVLFRRDAGPGTYRSGYLRNISQGGILFETAEPLTEGDIFVVFFKEKNAYTDTRMKAQAIRVDQTGNGYIIGARFI